jgi:hypothetical protein
LNGRVAKKNKPRTPAPPRKVQAPQRRVEQRRDDLGLRHRAVLYGVAVAGVVGLIAVVILISTTGGSNKTSDAKAARLALAAGCSFRTVTAYVPKGQGTHVASLTAKLPWNTDPPSNGQHYPSWAVWGFYTTAINPRMVVHNEEHGGVVLWWGSKVPQSTVDKLHAFYLQEATGSFGTLYPKLGSEVAITAWTGNPVDYQHNGYYGQGHIAKCSSYTPAVEKAFTAFRKAYIGKGPEGYPLSADAPGLGP